MNTITVIMADEPADAWAYALKMGFPDGPHLAVHWPEIDGGRPVSNARLLTSADQWVAMLPERSVHVVTHSTLVVSRFCRRVAEGVLSADALRIVFVGADGPRGVEVNEYGAIQMWPEGWCDADLLESEAIVRASLARRASEKAER